MAERLSICMVELTEEAKEIPMSRVERTENPTERRGSEQLRQAQQRGSRSRPEPSPNPSTTPGKAEGEVRDVEEALRHQEE